MKKVKLTRGQFALIDDEDFGFISQWKWYAMKGKKTFYACRGVLNIKGNMDKIMMHRVIMNTPKGMDTDHIDGNGLNNQKHNLRACSRSENSVNRSVSRSKKSSKYKGVFPAKNKWVALIAIDKKYTRLGLFNTQEQAAIAYNEAAQKHHGEFAVINSIR